MVKMSEICKTAMVEGFGFTDSELSQIENFINKQDLKTAKEILDDLIKDKRLDNRQKIIISYIIGNSVAHESERHSAKGIEIDIPYFGG